MKIAIAILASSLVSTGFGLESSPNLVRVLGPQAVNLWRLDAEAKAKTLENAALRVQDSNESLNSLAEFPVQVFEQPLDHFGGVNGTFNQRYWVNSRHYTSGGPVIVLDGGETSGEDRLQFLDTGIVEILAKATGGLGVVLEHRYYGMLDDTPVKYVSGRVLILMQVNLSRSPTSQPTIYGECYHLV